VAYLKALRFFIMVEGGILYHVIKVIDKLPEFGGNQNGKRVLL